MTKQGVKLLKTELDLSFTSIAVALTAYAEGSLDHARQAANDARKGYQGAKKLLAKVKLSQIERRSATDRLKDLEQVLARIKEKDADVFDRPSSAKTLRK